MFCTNCGKENPDTNKFCLQCGKPLAGAAPPPAGETASPAAPSRSSNRLPLILGGALLLVALAAAAWFLLPRLLGGGGGREMLLISSARNDTYDLSVLRLGDDPNEALTVAEGVTVVDNVFLSTWDPENQTSGNIDGPVGGFLPGTNRLVTYYEEDGETRVMEYRLGDEVPVEILSSDADMLSIVFMEDSGKLFLHEYTDGEDSRCFVAEPGEEAERVARSMNCMPTSDGSRVVTEDRNNDGEVTVTAIDLNSGDEVTLMDDVVAGDFLIWTGISVDGSRAVYTSPGPGGESLTVVDGSGESVFDSETFANIKRAGFIGTSNDIYYIAQMNDSYGLYTTGGGPWVESAALDALPIQDGQTIAVITADGDGAGEALLVNSADGAVTPVLDGEELSIAWMLDPVRLLVKEVAGDEVVLTAVESAGANPVTLFDDSGYELTSTVYRPGDGRLLLNLMDEDGMMSLFVAPLDGTPGFFAIEEWAQFNLSDFSGDTLLFTGREDESDSHILFARDLAADADIVEVDDSADGYGSALISPDGRTAIYNVALSDNPDDSAVRQARLDGEEQPEELTDEAGMAAGRWATVIQPAEIFWTSAGTPINPSASTTGNPVEVVPVEPSSGGNEFAEEVNVSLGEVAAGNEYSIVIRNVLRPLTNRITLEYELRNDTNFPVFLQSGKLPVEFLDADGFTIPVQTSILSVSTPILLPPGFKVMDATVYDITGDQSSQDVAQANVSADFLGGTEANVSFAEMANEELASLETPLSVGQIAQFGDLQVSLLNAEGEFELGLENVGSQDLGVTFENVISSLLVGGDLSFGIYFFDGSGLACPPDVLGFGEILVPAGSAVRQEIPTFNCRSALGDGFKMLIWESGQPVVFSQ